ncbi:MAG: biopolymer transporter ExbD [Blastochloris sp.]|nr:biopolymer transporter ExbD [Blastochloris sp.]
MKIRRPDDDNLELQMASMMDCIFILLIFFVVTTTMKKVQKILPIELPETAAALSRPEPAKEIVLSVDATGQKYFNSEPVTTSALLDKLKEVALSNPQQALRLDADRDARYSDIVELVEAAQFQGLRNLELKTRTPTALPKPK